MGFVILAREEAKKIRKENTILMLPMEAKENIDKKGGSDEILVLMSKVAAASMDYQVIGLLRNLNESWILF